MPWSVNPALELSFGEEELRKVVMLNDRHKRNFETVRFFTELILRAIRDEEVKPEVWIIVIPNFVRQYCRPESVVLKSDRIEATGRMSISWGQVSHFNMNKIRAIRFSSIHRRRLLDPWLWMTGLSLALGCLRSGSIADCGLKLLALVRWLATGGGMRDVLSMEELIVIDPAICNGRPVVKGTRITVQTVMEFLAAGDSVDEVLEAYPSLKREQVLACMEWASRLMGNHFQIAGLA